MDTFEVSHLDIYHRLGRIEGKVDALVAASDRRDERLDTHSKRIGTLEKGRVRDKAFTAGVAATVSGCVTAVTMWFKYGGLA